MGDDTVSDEVQAQRAAKLAALGVPEEGSAEGAVSGQVSYFGFETAYKVVLPDGESYVEHTEFNEGDRKRYLNLTNRDLRLQQRTGDAFLKTTPGEDRHALLRIAITDWNLLGPDGKPMKFSAPNLDKVLNGFPPHIIDIIEKDIRVHNDWLLADATVEDIDKSIADLQEMRAKKVEEEAGKAGSSTK